jgi:hypothetical protein
MSDIVQTIAARLGENKAGPLGELERLVAAIGADRALALLDEALKLVAAGGQLTDDGRRKRTAGGIFFKLAKDQMTPAERAAVWSHVRRLKAKVTPLTPAEVEAMLKQALTRKGALTTVKMTLIGRPGRIIVKGEVVLTSLQSSGKAPALPRGLPTPPTEPTLYVVYIARKQWQKVAEAIKNPQDVLIIEGYPTFDKRLQAMTVFALNTTTKLLQQAQRAQQKAGEKGAQS